MVEIQRLGKKPDLFIATENEKNSR